MNSSIDVDNRKRGDLPDVPQSFMDNIDALIESSGDNPELVEGFKWLDMESRKRGITFYQMTYLTLARHEVSEHVKKWLSSR